MNSKREEDMLPGFIGHIHKELVDVSNDIKQMSREIQNMRTAIKIQLLHDAELFDLDDPFDRSDCSSDRQFEAGVLYQATRHMYRDAAAGLRRIPHEAYNDLDSSVKRVQQYRTQLWYALELLRCFEARVVKE